MHLTGQITPHFSVLPIQSKSKINATYDRHTELRGTDYCSH